MVKTLWRVDHYEVTGLRLKLWYSLELSEATLQAKEQLNICDIIIPHVNSPYKTSLDERLIFYNITRCYSDGEYCHVFAIAAGDIIISPVATATANTATCLP